MPRPGLFDLLPANACMAYRNVRAADNEHTTTARERCEDLWRDYEPLADPQFITEFALRFQERWFEMYLAVSLLRSGVAVTAPTPGEGPDLRAVVDGRVVWIEATCPGPGDPGRPGTVPVPTWVDMAGDPVVENVPVTEQVLRIRGALATKAARFEAYPAAGIVSPEDAAVIAISVRGVPHMWTDDTDRLQRCLYGIGDPYVTLDKAGTVVGEGRMRVTTIPKGGVPIGVTPFVTDEMPFISAVVSSNADCCSELRRLGEDLQLWPNIEARYPAPLGVLRVGRVWEASPDGKGAYRLDRRDA